MFENKVPNRILWLKDSEAVIKILTTKLAKEDTNSNTIVSNKDNLNEYFEAILTLHSSAKHGGDENKDGKDLNNLFQNGSDDETHEDSNDVLHKTIGIKGSILQKTCNSICSGFM